MEQPSLNTRFGKYHPIRFLTHWTLGERFIAIDTEGGPKDPPVIVDRLWPEFRHFDGVYEEVEMIRRWCRLSHPALVNVIAVGADEDGRTYVVSEYFEGLPLETYIQRREQKGDPIPRRTVLEMGVQLAQGLSALHKASDGPWHLGLVHGGLSPTRVLLDNRGRARLLAGWSTGLEKRLAWATPPRAAAYQAPELLWGHANPDHRVDLYSLGVVLYEALVGRFCPPDDPLPYVRRVLRRDPEETPGLDALPAPLAHLLRRLLATDPAQRPGEAATVAETLRSLIEADAHPEEEAPQPTRRPPEFLEVPPEPPTLRQPRPEAPTATPAAGPAPRPTEPPARAPVSAPPLPQEAPEEAPDVPPDEPEEPDISIRLTTVVPAAKRPRAQRAGEEEPGAKPKGAELPEQAPAPEEVAAPAREETAGDEAAPPKAATESLWFGTPVAPTPEVQETPQAAEEPPAQTRAEAVHEPEPGTVSGEARPEPEEEPGALEVEEAPVQEAVKPAAPLPTPAYEEAMEEPAPTAEASQRLVTEPESEPVPTPEPTAAPAGEPEPAEEVEEEEEPSRPLALQEPLPTKPRAFLVFREGSSQEYRFPLAGDVVTLGRSSNNTYQILSEIKASRYHCEFQYEQGPDGRGRWLLVDRRSTNGTYVNGRPIDVYELKGREKINIGFTTFRFLLADEDGNPIDATPERPREEVAEAPADLLRAALVMNEGRPNESRHEVKGEVFLIGSGPGNSLQIKGPKVAPCHCEIRVQDGMYVIEDHLSEHGTLVNGFLVDQLALEGGEEITVGDVTMRFVLF